VQPPVVTVNEKAFEQMPEAAFREILVKRLNALEAENKELKSQLNGLNAQVEAFKAQFANHTHDLNTFLVGKATIEDVNKKRVVVMTLEGEDWGNKFRKTGPPNK
jgi:peptidoglycan hydrolase CwlO-like protein